MAGFVSEESSVFHKLKIKEKQRLFSNNLHLRAVRIPEMTSVGAPAFLSTNSLSLSLSGHVVQTLSLPPPRLHFVGGSPGAAVRVRRDVTARAR
ncbi:hypothetical protein CEXT_615081 [Caerostris extrusa]|uniref:Uncharacterized protein n=1 Tax=Caerostris extrusa TaxID=172846 RepID=A0AAV4NFU5_CAEEX|nr:hypothetical protein CEXT_615081 [Caerostris extrusa]